MAFGALEIVGLLVIAFIIALLGLFLLFKIGWIGKSSREKKQLGFLEARDRMDDIIIDPERTMAVLPFAHLQPARDAGENFIHLFYSTGGALRGHDETFLRSVRNQNVISIDCLDPNSIAKRIHYIIPADPSVDPVYKQIALRNAELDARLKFLEKTNAALLKENSTLDVELRALHDRKSKFEGPVKPNITLTPASRRQVEAVGGSVQADTGVKL